MATSFHPRELSHLARPVEFVYDQKDKVPWLTGIVRTGDLESTILQNDSLHGLRKVSSKVVHDIQHALNSQDSRSLNW